MSKQPTSVMGGFYMVTLETAFPNLRRVPLTFKLFSCSFYYSSRRFSRFVKQALAYVNRSFGRELTGSLEPHYCLF